MTSLAFTVTFKTPFAVTSGHTSDGLDARVDRDELLPASSLKGLMRAEAAYVLGVRADLVADIFGTPMDRRGGSPWAWSDAAVVAPVVDRRARIKIDGEGRSDEGNLLMAEYVWADRAVFSVSRVRALDDATLARHRLVLRAAGRSVTSLGAARRRGQGWVAVTDDLDWTRDDTKGLSAIIAGGDHA